MSEEVIARVRRVCKSLNLGDFDAVIEAMGPMDPEIEWVPDPNAPDTQRSYRGRGEMKRRIIEPVEPFESREYKPVEIIESGERTFVAIDFKGQGRGSAAPFEGHLYQVITTRDPSKTVVRIENFLGRAEALEAAGLSE